MTKYLILLTLLLASSHSFSANTSETVFIISDDLTSATKYYNSRSDGIGNKSFLFNQHYQLEQIMYARPSNYRWQYDWYEGTKYRQLMFPSTSNYAYLERKPNSEDFLTQISPTRYRLDVDGSECMGRNCTMEENIISIVIPKRFNVLDYAASVKGNWKIVDSTYTFYSKYVSGASAQIIFEDKFALIYAKVFKDMSAFKDIEVENTRDGISVVMPMDNVFGAGSTQLNDKGSDWVKALGNTLESIPFKEVKIEGHADSIPVRKGSIYPSNWELSAARAAMAVRLLIEKGIDKNKLAAVGYADSRPIGDNGTPSGRAKNRRITFNIVPDAPTEI